MYANMSGADRRVMRKIEAVFLQFVEQVVNEKEPVLKVAETNAGGECPLHRRNQLKKFGLTVYMLQQIYQMIKRSEYTTKRDLYYQQKGTIFDTQRAVDRTISECCNVLNEERVNLHIISTAKGLVFGDLILKNQEGDVIFECRNNINGTVIPNHIDKGSILVSEAKYILLVEKDATFQRLVLTEKIADVEDFKCIVVTGKGYPDISTRLFLRKLSEELKLKVFCLTDSGAHGVEIMLTYKYGPKMRSVESDNTETPNMEWVGVKPSEIYGLSIDSKFLQNMDERELRKIPRLLNRTCLDNGEETDLKKQLEFLLVKQKKVEIQNISSLNPKYLTNTYLLPRIRSSLARDAAKLALEGAKKIEEE